MEAWVALVLVSIIAGTAYSAWKQLSYSIVASVICVFVLVVMMIVGQSNWSSTMDQVAFNVTDLTNPDRVYTLLTSMFAHASLAHLLFNVLGLVLIGMVFEQRIGAKPYILLFLLSGVAGTLTFAAVHWDNPAYAVLGASGAISGVLGGFARMYPNERMSMILFVFPLPPMPVWIIVIIFVALQSLFISASSGIAYEAHLGGLAAGLLLAPLVVKLPTQKREKRTIALSTLRKLATTPELKTILRRIEDETVPDVRGAWIEHFLSRARCPYCNAPLRVSKDTVMCQKGHLI